MDFMLEMFSLLLLIVLFAFPVLQNAYDAWLDRSEKEEQNLQ